MVPLCLEEQKHATTCRDVKVNEGQRNFFSPSNGSVAIELDPYANHAVPPDVHAC